MVLTRDGLDRLIEVLTERGYHVIGPTVRDGAIVLDQRNSTDALPWGWGADVGPGRYQLWRRTDGAAFANSAGPVSGSESGATTARQQQTATHRRACHERTTDKAGRRRLRRLI
jgi:hypothetical protein